MLFTRAFEYHVHNIYLLVHNSCLLINETGKMLFTRAQQLFADVAPRLCELSRLSGIPDHWID
jgi:hypothetical protein